MNENPAAEIHESAYAGALRRWRDMLDEALALANDPFKAPELSVYKSRDVLNAAWDLQIEYAAMKRRAERDR